MELFEQEIEFDENGWAKDKYSGLWIRSEPNLTLYTNSNGYLWTPVDEWPWPEANDPIIADSYYYVERHPTRYFWRPDVEEIARKLVNDYSGFIWCNTYFEHPEGWGFDYVDSAGYDGIWQAQHTSIDVWSGDGRGSWLNDDLGDEIFSRLWNDPAKPDINWIIYKRVLYSAANGWSGISFGDGTRFTNHDDHIHVTYR